MLKAVIALVPSAGVLFLFVIVVRSMLLGDRRERSALARWEAEQDAGQRSGDAGTGPQAPPRHS